MADGKWIDGLTPDMPAGAAARAVLAVRLAAVLEHLTPAAEHAHKDVEHVHRLRVASRRAGAAVRIFRDLLPKKEHKKANRAIRDVRRAAGAARDRDVFLEALAESSALRGKGARPAAEFLTAYTLGERAAAQEQLRSAADDRRDDLRQIRDHLPKQAGSGGGEKAGSETLGDLALAVLGDLLREFSEETDTKSSTPATLHQIRIAGKRVRYAMEVFADCFAAPLKDALYPAIVHLQDVLGVVQDGHVADERMKSLLCGLRETHPDTARRIAPGLADFSKECLSRVREEKKAYRAWIKVWRKLTKDYPLPELLLTAG